MVSHNSCLDEMLLILIVIIKLTYYFASRLTILIWEYSTPKSVAVYVN